VSVSLVIEHFSRVKKFTLYALIIAILQRFNLKKIVLTLARNHKIISTISFLIGVRMQSIMRWWRLGGGGIRRGTPTHALPSKISRRHPTRDRIPKGPKTGLPFIFPLL